jgi:hypothetical protein
VITKRQFLDSCRHEIAVVKHLAGKVPQDRLDWRPTPRQRSILELLRYLTTCAIVPARALVTGSWEHAVPMEQASERISPDIFAGAMDVQTRALEEILEPLSDRDLLERAAVMPWGAPCALGEGLVNAALKTLVAYRMQLFLYAKQAGAHELGPANCWVGVDGRRDPAAATN